MKKIISIILAIIAIFAMSITSFAFTSMPEKGEPEEIPYVSVMATLNEDYTPAGKPVVFESYINNYAEKEEDKQVIVEGRVFEITFTIYNATKDIIYVDDVLEGFGISVINSNTEKTIDCWTKAKDSGFGEKDLSKIAINPNDANFITYKIYALTDKSVTINVTYEGKAKNVEKDAIWMLINDAPATPDVPSTESTTKAPETSTEAPTQAPDTTTKTEAPTITEKAPADIDPEIPDTGAVAPVGAIGTLIGSAVAAVIAKKRKKD